MIVFHEGLPRSGKSYESVVRRIIPALQKGRTIDAYVEGLDHAKLAALAEISEERCRELLQVLTREQVQTITKTARDNSLVVLDEAQNFWPARNKPLGEELTQFVTEHGHRGMDIVLMGQDLRDVHALWRRRVELKLCFLKLSALGQESRYSVTTYRHKGGDQWEKVGTQTGRYEAKYFGTYKSHTGDDINTANYRESRASIWANPLMRFGLPLTLVGAIVGGKVAWDFFHPKAGTGMLAAAGPQAVSAPAGQGVGGPRAVQSPAAAASAAAQDTRSVQERRFADMSTRYRIRLAGLIESPRRVNGYVEWIDSGSRVVERLTLDALRDLGVAVVRTDTIVRLTLGGWSDMATMWPLEADGRVSEARQQAIRGVDTVAVAEPAAAGSLGPVSVQAGPPPAREPAAPLDDQRQPRVRR